ncbi:hypothetical protein [Candidatus Cytomitobacter primus]|uniref:Uncharacterized protein n=1 Tax=Candidatus Cytomitobacter primus TaxID=2066024 RepID=A0A5C0UIE6_9PROT|nr:hypothetical protein [Candidatus Cytomitobacter primus]QEK38714.1 hypothetical protein FZC34_02235 [Candidatus Cytomitobacter primus]
MNFISNMIIDEMFDKFWNEGDHDVSSPVRRRSAESDIYLRFLGAQNSAISIADKEIINKLQIDDRILNDDNLRDLIAPFMSQTDTVGCLNTHILDYFDDIDTADSTVYVMLTFMQCFGFKTIDCFDHELNIDAMIPNREFYQFNQKFTFKKLEITCNTEKKDSKPNIEDDINIKDEIVEYLINTASAQELSFYAGKDCDKVARMVNFVYRKNPEMFANLKSVGIGVPVYGDGDQDLYEVAVFKNDVLDVLDEDLPCNMHMVWMIQGGSDSDDNWVADPSDYIENGFDHFYNEFI